MYNYFNYSDDNCNRNTSSYGNLFNNVNQAIHTVLSSSIFRNKNKNKCSRTNVCGSNRIEVQEKILDIAQTNLQAQKITNILQEKLAQSETVFKQCIPEYIPAKEKEIKRKQYMKDYNKAKQDKRFSEVE